MDRFRWIAGSLCLATAGAALAQAPKFPVKPVRMLVGFAPGGATDIIARLLAPSLGESLGQSVVVENRPGASSQIAGELVARSTPDGHTLLMTTQTLMTSQMIEGKTFPDLTKDFVAVSLSATSPLILVVNPSLPVKTAKELIALARSRPGEMNYGTGGIGTTPHMSGELLATMAKLKLVHVPFKGEAPALVDVIAGHVPMMFSNITASLPYVRAGRLRMIAQTGLTRSPVLPEVPTMAESGLPGFEIIGFFGVMAPAGTPREIVARLNGELAKSLARPDVREKFTGQALDPGTLTADQFTAFIKEQAVKFGKVIRDAHITAK
ncbi:MAG: tripartite tricarboxylate transporter substrate binding protein [Betaproteobacteria bacterium]|nr:tripartite tricarboxylate transporter substrate binding protein [Betaproteobacteria bacterium]